MNEQRLATEATIRAFQPLEQVVKSELCPIGLHGLLIFLGYSNCLSVRSVSRVMAVLQKRSSTLRLWNGQAISGLLCGRTTQPLTMMLLQTERAIWNFVEGPTMQLCSNKLSASDGHMGTGIIRKIS